MVSHSPHHRHNPSFRPRGKSPPKTTGHIRIRFFSVRLLGIRRTDASLDFLLMLNRSCSRNGCGEDVEARARAGRVCIGRCHRPLSSIHGAGIDGAAKGGTMEWQIVLIFALADSRVPASTEARRSLFRNLLEPSSLQGMLCRKRHRRTHPRRYAAPSVLLRVLVLVD